MSTALKGKYKDVLVHAANSSLTTNTWDMYATIWRALPDISRETGIDMALPMTLEMLQAIIGYYLVRGIKTS